MPDQDTPMTATEIMRRAMNGQTESLPIPQQDNIRVNGAGTVNNRTFGTHVELCGVAGHMTVLLTRKQAEALVDALVDTLAANDRLTFAV